MKQVQLLQVLAFCLVALIMHNGVVLVCDAINFDDMENYKRESSADVKQSSNTSGYQRYKPRYCDSAKDCGDPEKPRFFCVRIQNSKVCKRPASTGDRCSPEPENERKQTYYMIPPCSVSFRRALECVEGDRGWRCERVQGRSKGGRRKSDDDYYDY